MQGYVQFFGASGVDFEVVGEHVEPDVFRRRATTGENGDGARGRRAAAAGIALAGVGGAIAVAVT